MLLHALALLHPFAPSCSLLQPLAPFCTLLQPLAASCTILYRHLHPATFRYIVIYLALSLLIRGVEDDVFFFSILVYVCRILLFVRTSWRAVYKDPFHPPHPVGLQGADRVTSWLPKSGPGPPPSPLRIQAFSTGHVFCDSRKHVFCRNRGHVFCCSRRHVFCCMSCRASQDMRCHARQHMPCLARQFSSGGRRSTSSRSR